jgi:hypothetical protein
MSVIKDNITAKYFSVKLPLRIGSMRCIPSICYELRMDHRQTIIDLVKKDQAILYEDRVRFISGKAHPCEAAPAVVKPSVVQAEKNTYTKKVAKSSSSSVSTSEFPSEA